jgi:hypothetical protein
LRNRGRGQQHGRHDGAQRSDHADLLGVPPVSATGQ